MLRVLPVGEQMRVQRGLAALLLLTGGCLAAAPPTRSTVAVGSSLRDGPRSGRSSDPRVDRIIHARIGMAPLGWVRSLHDRRVDITAGYVVDADPTDNDVGDTYHGGFVGLSLAPWVNGDPDGLLGRLSFDANGDLLLGQDDAWGGGLSLGFTLEMSGFVEGALAEGWHSGAIAAATMGEIGVALAGNAGLHAIGPDRYWLATLGLGLRLPSFAGIAIASPK